jgi:hypothetical protein
MVRRDWSEASSFKASTNPECGIIAIQILSAFQDISLRDANGLLLKSQTDILVDTHKKNV